MAELKMELMSGVADFRSVLHNLDGCLARLICAEDDLQRELQRLARLESLLDPRRFMARLRALLAGLEARLTAGRRLFHR